jgi:hypothetical protein
MDDPLRPHLPRSAPPTAILVPPDHARAKQMQRNHLHRMQGDGDGGERMTEVRTAEKIAPPLRGFADPPEDEKKSLTQRTQRPQRNSDEFSVASVSSV